VFGLKNSRFQKSIEIKSLPRLQRRNISSKFEVSTSFHSGWVGKQMSTTRAALAFGKIKIQTDASFLFRDTLFRDSLCDNWLIRADDCAIDDCAQNPPTPSPVRCQWNAPPPTQHFHSVSSINHFSSSFVYCSILTRLPRTLINLQHLINLSCVTGAAEIDAADRP